MSTINPVIEASRLDKSLLPTAEIACTTCPMATWFSTPGEMSCHCGRMYLVVWNSHDEKNQITECSAQQQALVEVAG